MSYCLNPACSQPQNDKQTQFCVACGTNLLVGARYRAIRIIGQGGFGRTLLAEDEQKPSKPRCVIKQSYSENLLNAQKAKELFEREAIRLEKLSKHPQIPELYAYIEQNEQQYIVQEFIDGLTLEEELAQTGTFSEEGIREILRELLPVLQFIHQGEVIHRDIKPTNIIRRRWNNQLVLVDFGAAKQLTATVLAKTGTLIGTAEYIAPEQTRGKAVFASDIYSLGVTCLYLLTGISPFDLYDISDETWIWRQYLVNNPASEELGRILDKMVCNSLKSRYQAAGEVMRDFGTGSITASSSIIRTISDISTSSLTTVSENYFSLSTTLSGCKGSVFSIALSPNGQQIASASGSIFSWLAGKDNSVRIWNLNSGIVEAVLEGHAGHVLGVAFSPDGRLLASCSNDKTIQLFQVDTGAKIRTIVGHAAQISSIAFSPDGQTLASCSNDNTVKLWEVATGQLIRSREGNNDWLYSVVFSPDGQKLASGGYSSNIQVWDAIQGGLMQDITKAHSSHQIRSLAFSPDGNILASSSADKSVKLWDVHTGHNFRTLMGHTESVFSVAFSPDGQMLASGSQDYKIKLWEVNTGKLIQTLEGHTSWVRCVVFSADGKVLISGGDDAKIRIWQCN